MAENKDDSNVRHLAEMARDVSAEGRGDLYGNIADMFEQRNESLSDNERVLMVEILKRLSRDVEMSVRRALSDRLAEQGSAPYELVRMLADDELLVAEPVLSHSPMLKDQDLIDIIRHRTRQHHLAIVMRKNLSQDVASALVDAGDRDVIITLLNNHDAKISQTVLEYLSEESRRVDDYQKPLIHRPDLPEAIASRMYEWVSSELKSFIVERYELSAEELDRALKDSIADVSTSGSDEPGAAERLVDQLRDRGKLNGELILRALQQGQVSLFEAALAALSGVNRVVLQRLVYEEDGRSLAIVCRAVDVDRSSFLLICQAMRQSGQTGGRLSKRETIGLSQLYDGVSAEAADLQVQRWRRQLA